MKSNTANGMVRLALLALGLAINSASVLAGPQTITANYAGSANFGSGGVGYGSGSIAPNPNNSGFTGVGVGGDSFSTTANTYSFTSATGSFNTWCVDIFHWLQGGSVTYNVGGASELSTVFGSSRVTALTSLINEQYSKVNNLDTSAAFQLATWAIMFGTPGQGGGYSLNSATFQTSSGITGEATAQDWLANLGSAPTTGNYKITYLYQLGDQHTSQNLITLSPVPEPETYAMLLVGLGLIGLTMLQRKRMPLAL